MRLVNLEGKRFGKLLVIDRDLEKRSKRVHWNCLCDCGNVTTVDSQNLRSGHTKSCGQCKRYEDIGDGTIKCTLSDGRFFLFDAVDRLKVTQYQWSVAASGYVEASAYSNGNCERIRLHRLLMDIPTGMCVDHINGRRWDNRRCNLRLATISDNARNHRIYATNTSGYKGVSYDRGRGKFEAYIHVDKKKKHLGYFADPVMAAKAYDRAAVIYYGQFAHPNFKEEVLHGKILEMGSKQCP